ncbi:hypothetical protein [Streptomyces viridochromogenes]|uniref:hypothetical protein n=1 Tax=Streptomyces viridochromogenes TaxID=1938 RepID=UPI0001B4FDDF|nr:hypothetical protein [Streptomyces viridochromogenes]
MPTTLITTPTFASTVKLRPRTVAPRRVPSVAEVSANGRSVVGALMPSSRGSMVKRRAWPVGGV